MPPFICHLLGAKKAKLVALVLGVTGIFLNGAAYVAATTDQQLMSRLLSVILGQVFWVITFMICVVQGNLYAESNISADSKGYAIFNAVKWSLVVVYLIACAVILEVAYEGYFIYKH